MQYLLFREIKNKFLKFVNRTEFSKNVFTLVIGSTVAQSIPFLIIPVLTRIYSPEEFGNLAIFLAIVSIFSLIATGRYEIAIVLPDNDKDATDISFLSIFLAIAVSLLFFIFLFFFGDLFLKLIKAPELSNVILLIPVAGFLLALFQTINYWLYRKKKFKSSSVNKVTQTGSTESSNVILGILGVFNGMIFGRFIGLVGHRCSNHFSYKKRIKNKISNFIRVDKKCKKL